MGDGTAPTAALEHRILDDRYDDFRLEVNLYYISIGVGYERCIFGNQAHLGIAPGWEWYV